MSARSVPSIQIAAALLGAVLMALGCGSNSNTEVQLPNGIHCRSESHGSFLWKTTSTDGKVIGSYSNY